MSKRNKALPPLTPRAREIVTYLVNAVALGTHDNDAEIGAMAKKLGITAGRLQPILRKLQEQGWLAVKNDFVYPTVAALQWQNPTLSEQQAKIILGKLR